ncbi:46dc12d5-0840-4724-9e0b-fcc351d440a4 [Thermothielavioides terrestris]|nr:46dc12d5-0840-4724-9e0b-fcc351d440a4 [Thermothielavioides terrestris]
MPEGTLPRRPTGSNAPWRTNAVPIDDGLDGADQGVPPPAYGEHHDQVQISQAGFAADAAVTDNGRVNIHINEKNRRLHELLAPSFKRQRRAEAQQLPSGPLPPPYIPPSLGGQPGQTPPPRLNVVIQIVGSRGDVQPFVALGQVLRDTYGHRVRLATHANFRSFVEENGLEFFNIGGDPAKLMAFMVKNPGLMPGLDSLKSGDIKQRRQEINQILMGCWRSCIEAGDGMGIAPPQHRRDEPLDERFVLPGDPKNRPFVADAIIANPPSFAHIHVAEKLGIPLHIMFTMPWTPTRAFPHPLADIVATNTDAAITNYVSYALVEMMTWQGLGDLINRFRTNVLDLEPLSLLWAPGLLNRLRVPVTYCWSPALTPKPADWAPEITVSGFFFLNLESSYTPERELAAFLAAGPPPVYIGFGSIVVDDPHALTRTVFGAVVKAGVRAIVSQGWGGIGGDPEGIPEGVLMLGNCPHDWLFKRVSAVVHHGGAGTTAAGILAGRPTVVVPFFGDQIFWGSMVARAGVGPAPIPYKRLTAEGLARAIEHALLPETLARARELGDKIKAEKGADVGGKSFHQFLNTDAMRCSLAPSRVAVWRVRRSKVRLSALAAAVLVKQGWLKYSDLKLYRSMEYNTDEQPWDPISAVVSAVVGDLGELTMALADFPREVFKAKARKDGARKPEDVAASTASDVTSEAAGSSSHQHAASHSETASTSSSAAPASAGASVETLLSLQPSTTSSQPPINLSSDPPLPLSTPPALPPRSPASSPPPPPPPPPHTNPEQTATPTKPASLDLALAAGRSVGALAASAFKMQADVCLGLARGFRNAPKLYHDETVRAPEKVTGLASGVRVAGREFGLGLYDGISGLVTQPLRGAGKEGGRGLVKGVGKGIGGFILKNAGAVYALPAYTMLGVRAEVRKLFARSSVNYVITSRVLQGEEDFEAATEGERRDVLGRWLAVAGELKGFYALKQREGENATAAAGETAHGPPITASSASSSSGLALDSDESLERAIQQSVAQTSRGDREEDARVEAAVRASLMEMRRVAEQQQQHQQQQSSHAGQNANSWIVDLKAPLAGGAYGVAGQEPLTDEEWTNISDEEYQALVEEAVRQSLLQQQLEERERMLRRQWAGEGEKADGAGLSGDLPPAGINEVARGDGGEHQDEDEDEQLRRALAESEREHRIRAEDMARQRTEEDIVLEYVKRQSLAEEEYRQAREAAKGNAVSQQRPAGEDDEDEDLRKA